jgi:hypothetical protein
MIQANKVTKFIPAFQKFLSAEGGKWKKEREDKDAFFAKYFSKDQIDKLDEGTLRELIHILWAFNGWTNKDWLHEQMLKSGLPAIRSAFKNLLYGTDSLAKRFDEVRKNIFMMGAASISEILTHHDHTKYPIWNSRSRKGLVILGVDETLLPKSSQISGSQYHEFCSLVEKVRAQVAASHPEFTDLFTLDFLLYFVSTQVSAEITSKPEKKEDIAFDHDEAIEQILELGDGLGFEVQKEYGVARGCRVDAIWRSRVANLGTIAYAFEVHRKGSRDSAILNLQRVRKDPAIQKVIVVSSSDELAAFREEITTLDESFRNSVGYFDISDLRRALENLQQLKDILNTLGLLRVEAPKEI